MSNVVDVTFDFRSLISDSELLGEETQNIIRQLSNLEGVDRIEQVRDEVLPDGAMGSGKAIRGVIRATLGVLGWEPFVELLYELLKIYYKDKNDDDGILIIIDDGNTRRELTIRSSKDLDPEVLEVLRGHP